MEYEINDNGLDAYHVKRPYNPAEDGILAMRGSHGVGDMEWNARQIAVGVPLNVEVLRPHEIVFLERFVALGNCFYWIPRDRAGKPTNDFYWVNRRVEVELKSMSSFGWKAASKRISLSARKARAHSVVKEVFVLDYGDCVVSSKLEAHLGQFNSEHNQEVVVKELWILDTTGLKMIGMK
jgi:hypothetical protein